MDKDTDLALTNDLQNTIVPHLDQAQYSIQAAQAKLAPLRDAYGDYKTELDSIDADLKHFLAVLDEVRPDLRIGSSDEVGDEPVEPVEGDEPSKGEGQDEDQDASAEPPQGLFAPKEYLDEDEISAEVDKHLDESVGESVAEPKDEPASESVPEKLDESDTLSKDYR